jgi:hypothetical protein
MLHFKYSMVIVSALICAFAYHCSTAAIGDDAAPAAPADAAPAGPFTLAYKFTAGKVLKYSLSVDMIDQMSMGANNQKFNAHIDMSMTQTTKSVDPDTGNATELVAVTATTGIVNGQPMDQKMLQSQIPAPMTLVMSPAGKVISSSLVAGQAPVPGATNPNSFGLYAFLPANPVIVGEEWKNSVPLDALGLTIAYQIGLKSVALTNGAQVAQLESKYTSSPAPFAAAQQTQMGATSPSMTGDFLTKFDIDAGEIKSVVGHMVTDMSSPVNAQDPNQMQGQQQGAQTINTHIDMRTLMTELPPQ